MDVVAAGSRVYTLVNGWNLRATDSATGSVVWEQQLVPPGPVTFGMTLAAAPDGSAVYAAGRVGSRATLVRVSAATGARDWITTVPDLATASEQVAVTPDGSSVVVTANQFAEQRIVALGFDPTTGEELWRGSSAVDGWESAFSQAVAPDGSRVFAIGHVWDGQSGDSDGLVVAFEIDGTVARQAWTHRVDAGPWDLLFDAKVSPDGGTLYVVGSSELASGVVDMSAAALGTANGARRWTFSARGAGSYNEGLAAALSPSGDRLYVAGTLSTADEGMDGALIAINTVNASTAWTKLYATPGLEDERLFAVEVSPDGSTAFATGISGISTSVEGTSVRTGDVVTVAVATQSGTQRWAARFRDPEHQGSRDAGVGLAVSPSGSHVHVLAQLSTSRSSTAPALASFRNEAGLLSYAA
jgi:hypothetical protein